MDRTVPRVQIPGEMDVMSEITPSYLGLKMDGEVCPPLALLLHFRQDNTSTYCHTLLNQQSLVRKPSPNHKTTNTLLRFIVRGMVSEC